MALTVIGCSRLEGAHPPAREAPASHGGSGVDTTPDARPKRESILRGVASSFERCLVVDENGQVLAAIGPSSSPGEVKIQVGHGESVYVTSAEFACDCISRVSEDSSSAGTGLRLTPLPHVGLRFLDQAGAAVESGVDLSLEGTASAYGRLPSGPALLCLGPAVRDGESGELPIVVRGRVVGPRVHFPAYEDPVEMRLGPDDWGTFVDVPVVRVCAVSGVAVRRDGRAAARCEVHGGLQRRLPTTASDGTFRVPIVAIGDYLIIRSDELLGRVGPIVASAEECNLGNVILEPAQTLEIKVTLSSARDGGRWMVYVEAEDSTGTWLVGTWDWGGDPRDALYVPVPRCALTVIVNWFPRRGGAKAWRFPGVRGGGTLVAEIP